MPGRGTADVIFCLDSSSSMSPAFDAVRQHVLAFVEGLKSDGQVAWDLRFDFVSHATSRSGGGVVHRHSSLHERSLHAALYGSNAGGRFFTADVEEFRKGLSGLVAQGDEANLIALDFCLDFPWRRNADCHRIVILLTDETLETGLELDLQRRKIPELIAKIHALGVRLFLIGPDSTGYDLLSAANGSEYDVVPEGHGLARADFAKVLKQIGRSVSASRTQAIRSEVDRGLFGQLSWKATDIRTLGGA
jgi:hypothetical protein